jgi:hypothetical protein
MTRPPKKHGVQPAEKMIGNMRPPESSKGNGAGRRLPLTMLHELGPVRVQDRLVRGLLGEGILAVIYGEPGGGKSFAASDLAIHIALGWPWLGRKVAPGSVLYVASEAQGGWPNRVEAFCRHHQIDDNQRQRIPVGFVLASVDLGPQGGDVERIVETAAELATKTGEPVKLIVIDTLARTLVGGDENSSIDMSAFVAKCEAIRQFTGATVLIVHHSGKNAAMGARGHSALRAAIDAEFEVEQSERGRLIRIRKAREGTSGDEIGFALQVVEVGTDHEDADDLIGTPITSCVVQAAEVHPKSAKAKEMAKWQLALPALDATLADHPEEPPNRRKYPTNCTLTKVERFRIALESRSLIDGETDGGRRSQWRNIKNKLIAKGHLRIEGDLCWKPVP